MTFIDYPTVIRDFAIDFTSLYFFAYVVLYKRYRNVELFVTCSLFNIFVLLIVMTIVRTDFNVAVGFGLFALLSLIQLRSAQFTKTEMAYLFGCVALAVINGAGVTDMSFVLLSNLVIILTGWIFGTWSLEHSANLITVDNARKMAVTLDHIDEGILNDRARMTAKLVDLLGIDVQSFEIKKVDYVRDIIDLTAMYLVPDGEIPQHMENVGPELDGPEFLSPAEEQTARTIRSSYVKQPEQ